MRITQRQLQAIIREELIRTMTHSHVQKRRPQLHESFKAVAIGAASGLPASAIDRFMPLFAGKVDATSEEAVAITQAVIDVDYNGDVARLISDFRRAIRRGDAIVPVLAPLIPKDKQDKPKRLMLGPLKAVISAVEARSGQNLDDIFTAVKAMAKRLTGSEGRF